MHHNAERWSRAGQGAAINRDEFTSDLRLEILLHRRILLQPPSLRSCLCSGCHAWLANVWQPLWIQPPRGYAGCFLLALRRLFYPQLSSFQNFSVPQHHLSCGSSWFAPAIAAAAISFFFKKTKSQHLPWARFWLFVIHFCTFSLFSTDRFLPWSVRQDWQHFYQILSPLASLQELLPFFSGSITSAITSLMISCIFHLLEIGTCELSC